MSGEYGSLRIKFVSFLSLLALGLSHIIYVLSSYILLQNDYIWLFGPFWVVIMRGGRKEQFVYKPPHMETDHYKPANQVNQDSKSFCLTEMVRLEMAGIPVTTALILNIN